MLVTFSTDAYANIMVFGDVAQQLLKMMGHSGSVPGAIVADDVSGALGNLKNAVQKIPDEEKSSVPEEVDDSAQDSSVNIKKRALPLIELLSAAENKKCDVMWK